MFPYTDGIPAVDHECQHLCQKLQHREIVFQLSVQLCNLTNLSSSVCLSSSTGSHFSMLGIGDIVMPGLLLCFVLRYDNYKKQANGEVPGPGRMQRVSYFHCTLIGYFVGE